MLRFAVHPAAQWRPSPRSHRMPCGDVLGCVHIRVIGISARPAGEDGLALARLRIHSPACAATLGGVRGINFLYPADRLFLHPACQQPPATRTDAPIQPSFLSHVPAGLRDSAPGRAGHTKDVQILEADDIELASQPGRGLFSPVLAAVSLTCFQLRYRELDLLSPDGPPTGSSELALQSPQPGSLRLVQGGAAQEFTSRQGSRHRYPPVDSNDVAGSRARKPRRDHGERDVPSTCAVESHPIGLCRRYSAGPPEPNPPQLRYPDLPRVARQPPNVVGTHRYYPKPFVLRSLPPRRLAVGASEVVRHGLGEVPKRLLLDHLAPSGQPRIRCASHGQLRCLHEIARRPSASWAPPRLLLHRKVPDEPGMRTMPPQNDLLFWRRHQPIAAHDSNVLATTDNSEEWGGVHSAAYRPRAFSRRICCSPSAANPRSMPSHPHGRAKGR